MQSSGNLIGGVRSMFSSPIPRVSFILEISRSEQVKGQRKKFEDLVCSQLKDSLGPLLEVPNILLCFSSSFSLYLFSLLSLTLFFFSQLLVFFFSPGLAFSRMPVPLACPLSLKGLPGGPQCLREDLFSFNQAQI